MNHRIGAVGVLGSWLNACGIPYESTKDGIKLGGREVLLTEPRIKALMSTDLSVGLKAFHAITEAAGYGSPIPVDRGMAPEAKVYDDPILPRFRHKEFRTAPNNAKALEEWRSHINRLARSFHNHNSNFLKQCGYEVDDIRSYIQVWTTTFVHRSALPGGINNPDNIKLLTTYLKQRFGELYYSLMREAPNMCPDTQTAEMSAPGFYDEANAPSKEWKREHAEIVVKTPSVRKEIARQMLEEKLSELPHDNLVAVLEHATNHPCPDTARIASKKLDEHRASCSLCEQV